MTNSRGHCSNANEQLIVSSIRNVIFSTSLFANTSWPSRSRKNPYYDRCYICFVEDIARAVMAMTSERARKMAGEHAHLLFNIPVLHHQTVTFTAEHMLFSLAKQPIKMAFLQHMDVILIAEIGLISSSCSEQSIQYYDITKRRWEDWLYWPQETPINFVL